MIDPETQQLEALPQPDAAIEAAEANPVDYSHLARLVFLSYRFSQGGIGTQNRMLLYIEEHHQPNLFDEDVVPIVAPQVNTMVSSFFLNEKTHPATAVPWEDEFPGTFTKTSTLVTNELAGLFERFASKEQMHLFPHDPASLAMSIITMDLDYLTRSGGRAGDSEDLKVKVGPYSRDPFASLYVKHGILGARTHAVEFDDIFAQASAPETIEQLDSHTLKQLLQIIEIYVREHEDHDNNRQLLAVAATCEELLSGER